MSVEPNHHQLCQRQTISHGDGNRYSGMTFLDWHPMDDLPVLPLATRFSSFSERLAQATAKHTPLN